MKGAMGLAIAAGLGIVGAVCNWLYLQRLAQEQEVVYFIAVKPGVQLNIGDTFEESDLEPVPLPRARVGNLIERAPQWSARDSIVGLPANRPFQGKEIILDTDRVAPAIRDLADSLPPDVIARWVPIDARSVVVDQINPGDMVSFDPGVASGPTPAGSNAAGNASSRLIGPFEVLALGTRREPINVHEASGARRGTSGSSITIKVRMVNGDMEPEAVRLFEAIANAGNQGVSVVLHSSRSEDAKSE